MRLRTSRSGRALGVALGLVALIVVALLPPRLMPQQRGDGFRVVLCTGSGPLAVMLDEDGQPVRVPMPDRSGCAAALHAPLAVATAPALPTAPERRLRPAEPAPFLPLPLRSVVHHIPSARAPPAIL